MALRNSIEGGRSEYLAWFALSTIGFCAPVPRQSDAFLTDFLVYLYERHDGHSIQPSGPAILIQIKSNNDSIEFVGERLRTLLQLDLPYYIGVVDKAGMTLRLFQTRERISHRYHPYTKLTLRMEEPPADFRNSPPEGILYLGKPVATITIADLEVSQKRAEFLKVMKAWADIDLRLIGWNLGGFPISLAMRYQTNDPNLSIDKMRIQYNEGVAASALRELALMCDACLGLLSLAGEEGERTFDPVIKPLQNMVQAIGACASTTPLSPTRSPSPPPAAQATAPDP